MWEFAFTADRCGKCGANLTRRKPKDVTEVKAHPGEPDIEEWSFAPCPSCGAGVPVSGPPEAEVEVEAEVEPGD